jgi:peptidoglycan/xylan/chitin deacetylase (PgdA/CDA1 family)
MRARRWRNRREPRALILLYHRVAELAADPWALSVTPAHFAEQLAILRRHAPVLRLQELAQALSSGTLPRRSVVVTFDDGYADNLHEAKPHLERYGVPATVFVTTGFVGGGRECWWDELERLLLQPGTLPPRLELRLGEGLFRWDLAGAAVYRAGEARRDRHWQAWEAPPTARHALYSALWERLLPLRNDARQRALDDLAAWAGATSTCRATHRMLSAEDVPLLLRGGAIEIGGHTMTHPALAALPASEQRDELSGGKARLEALAGSPAATCSYPFGRRCDYTAETVALARAAGFACACANVSGVVTPAADPFQLPRLQVRDWNGRDFERWLRGWLDG